MPAPPAIRKSYAYSREPHEHRIRQRVSIGYNFLRDEGYPEGKTTVDKAKSIALLLFHAELDLEGQKDRTRMTGRIPVYKEGEYSETIVLLSEKVVLKAEDHDIVKIATDMFIEPDAAWAAMTVREFMGAQQEVSLQRPKVSLY